MGVLLAASTRRDGIRARAALREHSLLATRFAACATLILWAGGLAGVLSAERDRAWLGLTCVAAALLLAVATWLLLLETDDDYPGETPDEPAWWPGFERELREWMRTRRVPVTRS